MASTSSQACSCRPLYTTTWKKTSGALGKELEVWLSAEAIKNSESHIKNSESQIFAKADVAIIYAEGDAVRECQACKKAFDKKFRIPPIWWTTLSRRSNGYFGYENVLDASGTIRTGTISWVRFLMKRVNSTNSGHNKDDIHYSWVKLNAFVRWYALERRTEIVLFDHPEFAQKIGDSIITQIKSREFNDPFWVYPIMTGEVAALHDECVWGSRTLIRNYEKNRSQYRDPFDYLHEVSRHTLHINETLHVAESILDSMQKYHDHFISTELSSKTKEHSDPFSQNIRNRLGHFQTTLTHLRHRAESNHERVKAEISLSFNKSAQVESSATRSISLIGLLFLPAAFVASLFSTSFFNFDAPTGIWGLSDKFWIYWAVTIPVTAITIFLWFVGPRIWNRVGNISFQIRELGLLNKEERKKREEEKKEEKRRKEKEIIQERKIMKMV